MRIALVNMRFSESVGGVERFSVNLARELVREGHEIHVFANAWDIEPDGVAFHRVPMVSFLSSLKVISFARTAAKEVGKRGFDVVYSLTAAPGGNIYRCGGLHRQWLMVKHGNPVVRWLRSRTHTVHAARLRIEGRIYSANGHALIVANSHLGKEHLIFHYGIPAHRIRVVYNGVDTSVFHAGVRERYRAGMRKSLGIPGGVPVLLFLAANWERKGIECFLRALPRDGDYRAVVVGNGRSAAYRKMAGQGPAAGKVVFAGHTEESVRYYAAADLFVLPTRYDPFANVCLEALACGVPVITSRENGVAELIEPGVNGYILDRHDDSHTLRRLISEYLERPDAKAMSEAATRTAARYPAERTARETVRIFEDFCEGRAEPDGLPETDHVTISALTRGETPEGWEFLRRPGASRVARGQLSSGRSIRYEEYSPRGLLDRARAVYRGHRARCAQRGTAALRAKGLPAPQTLLTGPLPGGGSYLLSEAVPGNDLEEYWRTHIARQGPAGSNRRRKFIRELGLAVAGLHSRGLIHGNLNGTSICVEEAGDGWVFHFAGNEQAQISVSERRRGRDLAGLAAVPLPGLTRSDCFRFLEAYWKGRHKPEKDWKATARAVLAAATRHRPKEGGKQ